MPAGASRPSTSAPAEINTQKVVQGILNRIGYASQTYLSSQAATVEGSDMRLSTRDLFAVLTFVAVLAWCAGQVGYDNELFWISTIISLILAAIFAAYSAARDGRFVVMIVAMFLGGFCALPFGSLAVLLVVGLLFISSLVCIAVPITSYRVRCGIAMTCISAAFAYALTFGTEYVRQLAELRKEYPLESLDNRLDYEPSISSAPTPTVLHAAIDNRLAEDELKFDRMGNRHWDLERIHNRRYEQFVRATGFGVMRIARPRRNDVERPQVRDIPFNGKTMRSINQDDYPWRVRGRSVVASSPVESLHEVSRFDFLDTEGFGAVLAPRTQVAGFIEHAFHHHPLEHAKGRPKWSIDRLELVSLLKFDEPRVYVLDHLPRMDQLSSDTAPTRELNEFEAQALAKLRADEDLVVQSEGAEYQMLGSLRAARQCLDCHNVQRGELLGAFSYRLTLAGGDGESETELAAKDLEPKE